MTQLLVVRSGSKVEYPKGQLEAAVLRIMGAKPVPAWKRVLFGSNDVRAVASALSRDIRIASAMDSLTELLSKVLAEYPERALPNLRVVNAGDAVLSSLSSSTGTFATDTVYAAHPWAQSFFIPVGSFHAYLAEEKRAEFQRLCSALGARSVKISHEETKKKEGKLQVEAPLPVDLPVEAKLKSGFRAMDESIFRVSFSAEEAVARPKLPDGLRWYHHEPQWQAMAEIRLSQWITNYQAVLGYTRTFDVSFELALKAEEFGIGLGGEFHYFRSTSSVHDIEFFPRRAYEAEAA